MLLSSHSAYILKFFTPPEKIFEEKICFKGENFSSLSGTYNVEWGFRWMQSRNCLSRTGRRKTGFAKCKERLKSDQQIYIKTINIQHHTCGTGFLSMLQDNDNELGIKIFIIFRNFLKKILPFETDNLN